MHHQQRSYLRMPRAGNAKAKTKKGAIPKTTTNKHGVRITDVSSFYKTFEECGVPLDITPADVVRWKNNNAKTPEGVPDVLMDLIRSRGIDMIYAGTWLADRLDELGVDKELIGNAQFNLGRMGPVNQWRLCVDAHKEFSARYPQKASN